MTHKLPFLVLVSLASLVALAGCGGDSGEAGSGAGIRVISATDAAEVLAEPPADLVVLDVRTPEEFAAGHVDGAQLIDFYGDDFRTRITALDPDTPYLIYCRSGNRSGQTRAIMEDLGFADVVDVDGGIIAWEAAGLPLTTP